MRGGKFIGLKQWVGVAADVMNHHAAAGKGAVHQRLGGGPRALQGAGAHVNLSTRRAAHRQQTELAKARALIAPLIDDGGVAVAGQLPVVGGPLRPRTLGRGFDGLPVALRRRTNAVAAEFNHFFQRKLRGGVARRGQQRQGAGEQQA